MPSGKASKRIKRNPMQKVFPFSNKSQLDFLDQTGITVKYEGENLVVRSMRTTEQHEKMLASLQKRRPELLKTTQYNIDQVIEIFRKFDRLTLLGGLEQFQITHQLDPSDDGISEVGVEYGLSFATALPETATKRATKGIIRRLSDLLKTIRQDYNVYMMTEHADGKLGVLESKLRFKTILQALHSRGDAYVQHIHEVFLELFSQHDDFLLKHYDFKSSDILDAFWQFEQSFGCRCIRANGAPYSMSYDRFLEWSDNNYHESDAGKHTLQGMIEEFGKDNPDIIVKDGKIVNFSILDIDSYSELFKIRFRKAIHEKVAKSVSTKFGQNTEFLDPRFKGLPLNESKIFQKPIIEHDGNYYLFSFSIPTRNLFNITEGLMKSADTNYYKSYFLGNKYKKTRDNYLEAKTSRVFSKILPEAKFFENVSYPPQNTDEAIYQSDPELDLLIVSERANYLVEMKAGALSPKAKRGAIDSLRTNLRSSVGYGAFQNFRALSYINSTNEPTFVTSAGEKITVDPSKNTFRITITMEHFASLAAYLFDLKELGVIEKSVEFAWTCSLFDLMVFSEMLESEEDLISYLEARIPLYKNSSLDIHDELDLLGHFLDHGLNIDEENIKKYKTFQLQHASKAIDLHYYFGHKKPKKAW